MTPLGDHLHTNKQKERNWPPQGPGQEMKHPQIPHRPSTEKGPLWGNIRTPNPGHRKHDQSMAGLQQNRSLFPMCHQASNQTRNNKPNTLGYLPPTSMLGTPHERHPPSHLIPSYINPWHTSHRQECWAPRMGGSHLPNTWYDARQETQMETSHRWTVTGWRAHHQPNEQTMNQEVRPDKPLHEPDSEEIQQEKASESQPISAPTAVKHEPNIIIT